MAEHVEPEPPSYNTAHLIRQWLDSPAERGDPLGHVRRVERVDEAEQRAEGAVGDAHL